MKDAEIDATELAARLESHFVEYESFISDDFNAYFVARAKKLLQIIEKAMGKQVADKASEQTIKAYGCSLEAE